MSLSVEKAPPNVVRLIRISGRVFAARWVAGRLVVRVLRRGR